MLDPLAPGAAGRDELVAQLRALVPAVAAVGVFEIFEARSPELRDLVAEVVTPSPSSPVSRTA